MRMLNCVDIIDISYCGFVFMYCDYVVFLVVFSGIDIYDDYSYYDKEYYFFNGCISVCIYIEIKSVVVVIIVYVRKIR